MKKRAPKAKAKKPDARRRAFESMRPKKPKATPAQLAAVALAAATGADPRQLEIPGARPKKAAGDICIECQHEDCPALTGDDCPTCNRLAAKGFPVPCAAAPASSPRTHNPVDESVRTRSSSAVRLQPRGDGKRSARPVTRTGWGWPRPEPLPARINMRVTEADRASWDRASKDAGYRSVSDWIRDVCNTAAANASASTNASPGASKNRKTRGG